MFQGLVSTRAMRAWLTCPKRCVQNFDISRPVAQEMLWTKRTTNLAKSNVAYAYAKDISLTCFNMFTQRFKHLSPDAKEALKAKGLQNISIRL